MRIRVSLRKGEWEALLDRLHHAYGKGEVRLLRGKQPTVKTSGKRRAYKIFGLIDYFSGGARAVELASRSVLCSRIWSVAPPSAQLIRSARSAREGGLALPAINRGPAHPTPGRCLQHRHWRYGPGLVITRLIVEQQGGQIWLESQRDVGTTFNGCLSSTTKFCYNVVTLSKRLKGRSCMPCTIWTSPFFTKAFDPGETKRADSRLLHSQLRQQAILLILPTLMLPGLSVAIRRGSEVI